MFSLLVAILVVFAIAAMLVCRIEAVPEIFRRSARRMRRIAEWPLARDTYQTSHSDSGIGIVAGILGAAVTQVIALIINDKNKEYLTPKSSGLWFYEAGNLLLLGMLSGILRSTRLNRHGVAIRSYDMGTRYFVYFAAGWIILGAMLAVPIVGYMGEFPTHEKRAVLPVREPAPFVFTLGTYAGQEGLSFQVVLRPVDFDDSVPENLLLKIETGAGFNREWIVANLAKTDVLSGEGTWQTAPPRQATAMIENDAYTSGASREVTFLASHLLPTQSTRITFRLLSRSTKGNTSAARAVALNALKTEHPITVTATVPQGPTAK